MTPEKRVQVLVENAVEYAGGRSKLARLLGVTPNAITEWRKGRSFPNAYHLIRIQDLLKRVACVIFALIASAQAPENGVIGQRSATSQQAARRRKTPMSGGGHTTDCASFPGWIRALWRWLIGEIDPSPLRTTL
jgi:transcriptional regulator with XRE-family HTH domain